MTSTADVPVAAPKGRRWKRRLLLLGLLASPVVLFFLYATLTLAVSYSDGERAGILQKLSRKGWLCKTNEGELAMTTVPGVAPTIWEFSVRDDAVLPQLRDALGKKVVLHYTEHHGVPTGCFGATQYYVDAVRVQP
jgi:hypothetical protein